MYCKSGGIGAKKTIQGMGHDTIHTLTCSRMSTREIFKLIHSGDGEAHVTVCHEDVLRRESDVYV
jgi:hypothetical protein